MTSPFLNYTTPDWTLLEAAVASAGLSMDVCREFRWMGEWKAGEHSYKHIDTRKYVRLTANTCAPEVLVRQARL